MSNRTIRALSRLNGRVYVYLANEEIGSRFMKQAEDEGFKFGDGVKPTERHYSDVIAVNLNGTLNYVGVNGRIAFGSGAKKVGESELIRVDFNKYTNGEHDYMYKKSC